MKFLIAGFLLLTSLHSKPAPVFIHDGAVIHFSCKSTCLDTTKAPDIIYKIIDGTGQTFGYDIMVDGHLMVHQPTIPCLPGLKGFKKRSDAEKVALLVITKIKMGIMPPTITKEEMEKLGVSLK